MKRGRSDKYRIVRQLHQTGDEPLLLSFVYCLDDDHSGGFVECVYLEAFT